MPYLPDTAPALSPVIGRVRAVLLILEHAQRLDLPMPFHVNVTDYSAPSMLFDSLGDLAQWTLWIGATVSEQPYQDQVHHVAEGDALDQPVRLIRVEQVTR